MTSKWVTVILALILALFAVADDKVKDLWYSLPVWAMVLSFALPVTGLLWIIFHIIFKT